jgi:outer membrane protein assembly factor BamB
MKSKKIYLVMIFVVASMLLSACTGAVAATSWPGITADQDTIYISYQASVFAVRASDGSMTWRYPLKPDNTKLFYAPPAVSDGAVVVGSYHNILYSLDKQNGTEKWSFTDAKNRYVGGILPASNVLLAPSVDKNLYAVSPDGKLVWKFAAGNGLWAAPATDGKLAFLPSMDHNMYAVDIASGKQVWKTDLGGAIVSSPVISEDGMLYTGTLNNELVALTGSDGKIAWRVKAADAVWDEPVVSGGLVYFGDLKGNVYAVDAKSGQESWKNQVDGSVIAGPAAMPNGVVFGTDKGNVQAFSPKGEKLWTRTITGNGKLYSRLLYVNDKIVLGVVGGDKLIVTFDNNGNEGWSFVVPK